MAGKTLEGFATLPNFKERNDVYWYPTHPRSVRQNTKRTTVPVYNCFRLMYPLNLTFITREIVSQQGPTGHLELKYCPNTWVAWQCPAGSAGVCMNVLIGESYPWRDISSGELPILQHERVCCIAVSIRSGFGPHLRLAPQWPRGTTMTSFCRKTACVPKPRTFSAIKLAGLGSQEPSCRHGNP